LINRAIILAAGSSTRLRPLTNNIPKTLLKVGRATILDIAISILHRFNIDDIIVVTGHAADTLEEHVYRNYNNNTIRFRFIRNDKLHLGNIYSFYIAREYMDTDFILLNSDVLFHPKILEYLLSYDVSALAVDDHKMLGEEEMKVKVNESGIIKDISKGIPIKEADGEYIGVMKLTSKDANTIIKSITHLFNQGRYNLYYEDAIRLVAHEHDLFYKCSTRGLQCIEIDTHKDLNDAYIVAEAIERELL
jgi:L-glutamine-phosphate cytidylyltransferase